jgi:hypothetical protein
LLKQPVKIVNKPQSKHSIQNLELKTQNLGMEDFWSRQANSQTESFEFAPLGMPAKISANQPEVLAAARLSAGRFSRATESNGQAMRIRIVVRSETTEPIPDDLPERLVYSGVEQWITLSAGEWGHGFANLDAREAVIILSPALAKETRLVSRYFIDHYLLNFILADWAMLHASCVLNPDRSRLVVMIGPHNAGKSTTALHLLRAGYHFLADGMALIKQNEAGFSIGGYPIGEVKLRDDVLSLFPEYTGEAIRVREDRKTVVNLRVAHPERLVETLVKPAAIQLCFVEGRGTVQTRIEPLSPAQVWLRLMANTVYWDEAPRLVHHQATLQALAEQASLHYLKLGFEVEGLVAAVNELG